MLETIRKIELKKLLQFIPFAFALHELEEWNTLSWHRQHQTNIPAVADIDVRTILFSLILFGFVAFYLANLFQNKKITAHLLFPLIALLCYNGMVHLYWTIYFKDYSPGLIFGFFIGVPLTLFTMYKMIMENIVNKWYAIFFGVLCIALFIKGMLHGNELEPAIVNAMILGQKLAQWIWL